MALWRFRGLNIPEGTQVFVYHGAIHNNPDFFVDPDRFNPDRFLDDYGNFQSDPHVTLFGIGRRRCAGEALAKTEIYLFLTAILRSFRLEPADGWKPTMEYTAGVIFRPKAFSVRVHERATPNAGE